MRARAVLSVAVMGAVCGLLVASAGSASGEAQPQAAQPKTGWQKMFGALTGLSQYLSSRPRSAEQVLLARIAYLAILRQHRHAVASMPAPEPVVPPTAAEAPAAPPTAAKPALDEVEGPAPKRIIKLP